MGTERLLLLLSLFLNQYIALLPLVVTTTVVVAAMESEAVMTHLIHLRRRAMEASLLPFARVAAVADDLDVPRAVHLLPLNVISMRTPFTVPVVPVCLR